MSVLAEWLTANLSLFNGSLGSRDQVTFKLSFATNHLITKYFSIWLSLRAMLPFFCPLSRNLKRPKMRMQGRQLYETRPMLFQRAEILARMEEMTSPKTLKLFVFFIQSASLLIFMNLGYHSLYKSLYQERIQQRWWQLKTIKVKADLQDPGRYKTNLSGTDRSGNSLQF